LYRNLTSLKLLANFLIQHISPKFNQDTGYLQVPAFTYYTAKADQYKR